MCTKGGGGWIIIYQTVSSLSLSDNDCEVGAAYKSMQCALARQTANKMEDVLSHSCIL